LLEGITSKDSASNKLPGPAEDTEAIRAVSKIKGCDLGPLAQEKLKKTGTNSRYFIELK
jgi:hypothetical protein